MYSSVFGSNLTYDENYLLTKIEPRRVKNFEGRCPLTIYNPHTPNQNILKNQDCNLDSDLNNDNYTDNGNGTAN